MASSGFPHAPQAEDLIGLYQLCGSEVGVIAYLANLYGVSADVIAPTVRNWLADLPALPPPSRQRSAPPILAPAVRHRLASAAPPHFTNIMRIEPPCSAAGIGQKENSNLIEAMRALDVRLNERARAGRDGRRGTQSATDTLALPERHVGWQNPDRTFLGHVPEEAPVDYLPLASRKGGRGTGACSHLVGREGGGTAPSAAPAAARDDAALAAYLERSTLVHGQGKLAPTSLSGKKGSISSTWMTAGHLSGAALLRPK
jgi:hypothetical protein